MAEPLQAYRDAIAKRVHTVCMDRNLDAVGTCRVREQAECCLYRYLPLVYEAIHSVTPDSS